MSLSVRDGAGLSDTGQVWVRDGAGLSQIGQISVRDESGLSLVWSSASAIYISPDTVSGYGASNSAIFVTTGTVTIVGAPAGATIVWHSGNAAVTPTAPSSASTAFRARVGSGVTQSATISATVNGVDTNSISCDITNGGLA